MIESNCLEFLSKLHEILMCGFEEKAQKPDFLAKNGQKWRKMTKNGQTRIFFKNPLGTFFQTHQDVALCKKSLKSDARFSRYAVTHGRTDARTDARTHERESIGLPAKAERPINRLNDHITSKIITKTRLKFNPLL